MMISKFMNFFQKNYKWSILCLAYTEMFIAILSIQFLPPLIPTIMQHLKLNYAECGLLMGIVSLSGIFLCIPIGLFIDKIGFNKVTIISLLLTIFGNYGISVSTSFYLLMSLRFVSGIGIMSLAIITPSILIKYFEHKEIGLPMGIFNTAVPVGTILAYSLIGKLSELFGWRNVVQIITLISSAGLLLHFLVYQKSDEKTTVFGSLKTLKFNPKIFLIKNPNLWFISIIWLFYNAGTIAFSTFGCSYFQQSGFSIIQAGLLTSVVTWGALILSPIVGILLDKGLNARKLLIISMIVLALAFVMLEYRGGLWLSLSILCISAGLVPSPIYYLVPKIVHKENISLAYGYIMATLNIGILLGPYLTGFATDRWQTFNAGFLVMSLFCLFGIIFAYLLKFNPLKPKAMQ